MEGPDFPEQPLLERLVKLRSFVAERQNPRELLIDNIITFEGGWEEFGAYGQNLYVRLYKYDQMLSTVDLTDTICDGEQTDPPDDLHALPPGQWDAQSFAIDRNRDLIILLDGK